MEDYRKAQLVLQKYIKEYAKSLGEIGSGENYDGMPANHTTTTDLNADSKALRVGSAMYYCHYCRDTINRMFNGGFKDEAILLKNKYFKIQPLLDQEQARRFSYSISSFYNNHRKALKVFSDVIPTYIFNKLFRKVVNVDYV